MLKLHALVTETPWHFDLAVQLAKALDALSRFWTVELSYACVDRSDLEGLLDYVELYAKLSFLRHHKGAVTQLLEGAVVAYSSAGTSRSGEVIEIRSINGEPPYSLLLRGGVEISLGQVISTDCDAIERLAREPAPQLSRLTALLGLAIHNSCRDPLQQLLAAVRRAYNNLGDRSRAGPAACRSVWAVLELETVDMLSDLREQSKAVARDVLGALTASVSRGLVDPTCAPPLTRGRVPPGLAGSPVPPTEMQRQQQPPQPTTLASQQHDRAGPVPQPSYGRQQQGDVPQRETGRAGVPPQQPHPAHQHQGCMRHQPQPQPQQQPQRGYSAPQSLAPQQGQLPSPSSEPLRPPPHLQHIAPPHMRGGSSSAPSAPRPGGVPDHLQPRPFPQQREASPRRHQQEPIQDLQQQPTQDLQQQPTQDLQQQPQAARYLPSAAGAVAPGAVAPAHGMPSARSGASPMVGGPQTQGMPTAAPTRQAAEHAPTAYHVHMAYDGGSSAGAGAGARVAAAAPISGSVGAGHEVPRGGQHAASWYHLPQAQAQQHAQPQSGPQPHVSSHHVAVPPPPQQPQPPQHHRHNPQQPLHNAEHPEHPYAQQQQHRLVAEYTLGQAQAPQHQHQQLQHQHQPTPITQSQQHRPGMAAPLDGLAPPESLRYPPPPLQPTAMGAGGGPAGFVQLVQQPVGIQVDQLGTLRFVLSGSGQADMLTSAMAEGLSSGGAMGAQMMPPSLQGAATGRMTMDQHQLPPAYGSGGAASQQASQPYGVQQPGGGSVAWVETAAQGDARYEKRSGDVDSGDEQPYGQARASRQQQPHDGGRRDGGDREGGRRGGGDRDGGRRDGGDRDGGRRDGGDGVGGRRDGGDRDGGRCDGGGRDDGRRDGGDRDGGRRDGGDRDGGRRDGGDRDGSRRDGGDRDDSRRDGGDRDGGRRDGGDRGRRSGGETGGRGPAPGRANASGGSWAAASYDTPAPVPRGERSNQAAGAETSRQPHPSQPGAPAAERAAVPEEPPPPLAEVMKKCEALEATVKLFKEDGELFTSMLPQLLRTCEDRLADLSRAIHHAKADASKSEALMAAAAPADAAGGGARGGEDEDLGHAPAGHVAFLMERSIRMVWPLETLEHQLLRACAEVLLLESDGERVVPINNEDVRLRPYELVGATLCNVPAVLGKVADAKATGVTSSLQQLLRQHDMFEVREHVNRQDHNSWQWLVQLRADRLPSYGEIRRALGAAIDALLPPPPERQSLGKGPSGSSGTGGKGRGGVGGGELPFLGSEPEDPEEREALRFVALHLLACKGREAGLFSDKIDSVAAMLPSRLGKRYGKSRLQDLKQLFRSHPIFWVMRRSSFGSDGVVGKSFEILCLHTNTLLELQYRVQQLTRQEQQPQQSKKRKAADKLGDDVDAIELRQWWEEIRGKRTKYRLS